VLARAARRGEDEVEMRDDLRDAAIAEQAHPDDEPHDVLRGQLAAAHRRRAGRRQGVGNPLRVDRRAELFEARRAFARAQRLNGLPDPHRPHLRGGNHLLPGGKKIQNPVAYALSDRHWA
jgi:hypothetical protein